MAQARRPEIVVIAALAERNRVIGKGLDLPWRIPADLKRFKALTLGHVVVMGRRTFESLVFQFGGPLPGRENVVLTRSRVGAAADNVHVQPSLKAALELFADREVIFIGGGASVYAEALPLADRLELTLVDGVFDGDAFFPAYEHLVGSAFERVACVAHPADHGRPAFRFESHVRMPESGARESIAPTQIG